MEPQDLQGIKTGMNLWKQLIQQQDLPPAAFAMDYIEYQFSGSSLKIKIPCVTCHCLFSSWIWPVAFIPCSILTQPALQRRKPPIPDSHLDRCGAMVGGTICLSLGCTLGLKLSLPRVCFDVGVSQHGVSCYFRPRLARPCVFLSVKV